MRGHRCRRTVVFLALILVGWPAAALAGQTGKIVGKVTDAQTGAPLPYVNVVIEGTTMGAASDLQGDFLILNVPPGLYRLSARMVGYKKMTVENVRVFVDRTTRVNFKLTPTAVELGKSVVVVAEQPLIQKDLTATASSVSAAEISNMPVESFQDVLELQAGIVKDSRGALHIRGGRANEIGFMVDGVSVTDPFNGEMAVDINQAAIQEMKVISGTFNAEYGKVMSGIVEVVTKDPGSRVKLGGTFYLGDYLSAHKDLFYNIGTVRPGDISNLQAYFSGPAPVFSKKLGLYLSLRRYYNDGWLYGQRRFNPTDSSNFQSPKEIYLEQTGDNHPVPMNYRLQYYVNAKWVFRFAPSLKLTYNFLGDLSRYRTYNHLFKYNPDGDVTDHKSGFMHILSWNHMISPSTFYTLKLSHYVFRFRSSVYDDPRDPRYANPQLLINREDAFSFLTGGTSMNFFKRGTAVNLVKFDLTSQVTKLHQVKFGLEYKQNRLHLNNGLAYYRGVPGGGVFSAEAFFNQGRYTKKPVEFSAYVQDKIELTNMTLNLGLRYDYFNSNGRVPVDLRDPSGQLRHKEGAYKKASPKNQVSPRIGIAFPISATAVFHTSYGHFFQIPSYEYLYVNPRFAVAPGGLRTLMGNADLKPQSTVIYEIGYQQELFGQASIDVTGYYKDVRNLLGTRIYETYVLGDRYARYENRDYGNIRGITFSFYKRPGADHLSLSLNYTYQIAEGNASDPNHEFYNQQSNPPKKSNIQVVPLNWDQRHTVNLSLTYRNPRGFGLGIIGQFQSGLPYTPAVQSQETTFENSGRKPFNYTVDLRLFREFRFGRMRYNVFLKVYNLFDRKNELQVYSDTGRAGYSLVSHYIGQRREDVNTLAEWLKRPDFYSKPRRVLIGLDVEL